MLRAFAAATRGGDSAVRLVGVGDRELSPERFAHLLGGESFPVEEDQSAPTHAAPAASAPQPSRVQRLEEEVAALRSELDELRAAFERFREQF